MRPPSVKGTSMSLLDLSDHIVFNSFSQYDRFSEKVKRNLHRVTFGLRVNPEHSEAPVPLYDPCGFRSRLGDTTGTVS